MSDIPQPGLSWGWRCPWPCCGRGHTSQEWSQMQMPSRQTWDGGWVWHKWDYHLERLGEQRKAWQGGRGSLFPVLSSGPGRSPPPFNPRHLHSTGSWARASQPTCGSCFWGRQAGCPRTCPHMAPQQPHTKPTPESGQEQQSRGLPTAHILPSLLRLLQRETQPLTPWQDQDSCPHVPLPAHWGTGTLSCSPHPQLLTQWQQQPGSSHTSIGPHPRPLYLWPAYPSASCKSLRGLPPSLPPCSSLGPSHGAVPQAAGFCSRTVHCGSLWVFAWRVLFLIQVWGPLPPPQGGPPEAAASRCWVPLAGGAALPVPVPRDMAPLLAWLAPLSPVFPAGWSVPQSEDHFLIVHNLKGACLAGRGWLTNVC